MVPLDIQHKQVLEEVEDREAMEQLVMVKDKEEPVAAGVVVVEAVVFITPIETPVVEEMQDMLCVY